MLFFTGFLTFILFATGMVILVSHFYFKVKGVPLIGKVKGVEKYIATTRVQNSTSKSFMYRPLVEYMINGTKYLFVGSGRNTIAFVVGDDIKLLNIPSNPKVTKIDNSFALLFGSIFLGFSILPGYHFFSEPLSLFIKVCCILVYVSTFMILAIKIKRYYKGESALLKLLSISKFETAETLQGRDIFTTQNEVHIEEKKHAVVGLIITTIFFLIALSMLILCYQNLSSSSLEFIRSLFDNSYSKDQIMAIFKRDPKLVGATFGGFLVILSIYSLIFQLKKNRHV